MERKQARLLNIGIWIIAICLLYWTLAFTYFAISGMNALGAFSGGSDFSDIPIEEDTWIYDEEYSP